MICASVYLLVFIRNLLVHLAEKILLMQPLTFGRDYRAMTAHLTPHFDWQLPTGGMFVWATARSPGLDTDSLLQQPLAHGVCITPSSVFDPSGQDRRSIRINFTLNAEPRLEAGILRLKVAVLAILTA